MSVVEAWNVILDEGRPEPGWHRRRIHVGSVCDIHCAVRAPEKILAVLIETSARSVPGNAEFPDCLGFELKLETVEPGPNGRVRLCLVLKDQRFHDVFGILGDDVATVVAGAASEPQGVKLLLGRLHTWERFITRFGADRLSDEQQLGLFAELHFLATEVVPVMTAGAAVRAWRGPYMEAQDFRLRSVAIEIKSSSARFPNTFQVANLAQLDTTALDELLVYHLTIDADASSGSTLPEMVAKAREVLALSDPAAASDLDVALLEVGYLDVHAESYHRIFRVVEVRWLRVRDGFPRLTVSTVPPGVGAASYSVSFESCGPYIVDAESARELIRARL